LAEVLPFLKLSCDLIYFLCQLCYLDIDFEVANLLADFKQLDDVASVPLNGLDPHVVVHTLFHKGSVGECLGII
jgi:hypothetical protein